MYFDLTATLVYLLAIFADSLNPFSVILCLLTSYQTSVVGQLSVLWVFVVLIFSTLA